jgi:hypothetical protein
MAPTPHDLKTSARSGPPKSRIAAANLSIPVPGGFLVDTILLQATVAVSISSP